MDILTLLSQLLKSQTKISIGSVSFTIDNPLFWASVALTALFFLYRWGIKKFIMFNLILAGCLLLMKEWDTFIIDTLGKEHGEFYALLTRPLFIFIVGFMFIYYTFINKD